MPQRLLAIQDFETIPLDPLSGTETTPHRWLAQHAQALAAALAAGRPLLIRGDPGVGKTQLGRAAAQVLERAYVYQAVDANTGPHDLLWRFDAVARLADATLPPDCAPRTAGSLDPARYVTPGALWWALSWDTAESRDIAASAASQAVAARFFQPRKSNGVVVLIDEIDKADPSVPNALLDALGHGGFTALGGQRVTPTGPPPLILFTTNEERALPDAFLRRCFVLPLSLSPTNPDLTNELKAHGLLHFPSIDDDTQQTAAAQIADDRLAAKEAGRYAPGLAEHLDLLRALHTLAPNDATRQGELLTALSGFVVNKSPLDGGR
jgi:MoxR-like ATPase